MESINNVERRKKLITLGILLAVTVVLLVILAASFKQFGADDASTASANDDVNTTDLLAIDETLHAGLNKLQQYDEQYANLLTDSSKAKNFDSLNVVIARQEEQFKLTIDSLERTTDKIDDEDRKDQALTLISSFKSMLQYRKSVATLRNAVAVSNPAFSADERQLLQLQNELMDRDEKIGEMETNLAIAAAQKQPVNIPAPAPAANNVNEIKLREDMVLLETKLASLTESNNSLKEQNDQLKQTVASARNTVAPDTEFKARASSLQQRVDDLNAELRLAQVDCNLSRVDATQIISNARQRKQLLSEASSILTDLSSVNNAAVRQKVKDKIAKLNQVAANSRE